MAYGFNDGDQRRQSVRLAGRATPTPGSSSSSTAASPQYPSSSQRQPRPTPRQNTSGSETRGQASTAATRRRDGAVASSRSNAKTERRSRSTDQRQSTRSFTGTRQRQTDVPQLRRNGRPQPGIFVRRSFSRPQNGRSGLSSRPASRAGSGAPALPFRRARIALCSIVACLLFLFLGSCISHGSAGLEPTAEDKLLKAPSRPVILSPFRPRARNGKPARCPISIRSTLHGRSCLTPAVPSAKMLAGLRASPWSISLRRDAPI